MKIHARASAAVLAAAAIFAAAGCGGSGSSGAGASGPPTTSPTTATTPPASGAGGSTTSPPAGSGQVTGRCHTSMLSAHVTLGSPGAGQRYAFLVLTNVSGVTCQIFGYPGMQLANASLQPIATKVTRVTATPQLVTVTPGQHAFSQLHWTVVPAASETSNPCEPVPSVLIVTPPDETATLRTPWPGGSVCQLGRIDVTPFKPGTGS